MPDSAAATTPPDALAEESAFCCPVCGYDLRGTAGDRCSECGQVFDRAALMVSGVPWAHRKRIGRLLAWFKTIWLITSDRRSLRFEASKPHDLRDARRFRWIAAVIVACALIGAFIDFIRIVGYAGLAIQASSIVSPTPRFAPGTALPSWTADALVPWSAGATLRPTIPILLIVLAAYLTGAQQWLFRLRDVSGRRQTAAAAIGFYSLAPLVVLLPLALAASPFIATAESFRVQLLAVALAAFALILHTLRIVQWSVRVRHGGIEHGLFAAVGFLATWVLGVILILGVLPWCVGFFWIVIDSYR